MRCTTSTARRITTTILTTTILTISLMSATAIIPPSVALADEPPPPRGSIHEDSAREAAAEHRRKHRQQREVANAEDTIRAAVVTRALAQVGDSYGSGGSGPNVFDCSGLVVFSWRSAGVQLPHYSRAQYQATERISVKDARPGDLAFYFENGAHHVSIYVGDGKVVHASDYGIGVVRGVVKGTPWTNTHFTGMGRVTLPA